MIKVLIYGPQPLNITEEENGIPILGSAIVEQVSPWTEEQLLEAIYNQKTEIIIGWGDTPICLLSSPHEVLKRWVHFEEKPILQQIKNAIVATYNTSLLKKHKFSDNNPLVSIFTPTYNTGEMLLETYRSVKAQTYKNWEWIIVDDGSTNNTVEVANNIAKQDIRVKVFSFPHYGRIGFLKRSAACLGSGKYLVELDHDDFLTENCLEEIVIAFENNPDVGMVYSNCAEWLQPRNENNDLIPWELSINDQWNMYPPDYWMYRDTPWNGKICKEALQWDASGIYSFPSELGRILMPVILQMPICPNHVRAFRSTTYHQVGCHRDLVYADDYDLMLRIFIHSRILHIPKMLYVQRMCGNTWIRFNDYLVPMFAELRDFYYDQLKEKLYQIGLFDSNYDLIFPDKLERPDGTIESISETEIVEEARDGLKLDIGCGPFCAEGFIGVDMQEHPGVEIVHDLSVFPWPFEENSVAYIRAYHIFEHIEDVISLMNECYRILQPNGILEFEVPTTDGHGAFSDPTHKSFWNSDRLNYFCPNLNPVVFGFADRMGIQTNFHLKSSHTYLMRENVPILNAVLVSVKDIQSDVKKNLIRNDSELGKKLFLDGQRKIVVPANRSKIERVYCHLHGGIGDILYSCRYISWMVKNFSDNCRFNLLVSPNNTNTEAAKEAMNIYDFMHSGSITVEFELPQIADIFDEYVCSSSAYDQIIESSIEESSLLYLNMTPLMALKMFNGIDSYPVVKEDLKLIASRSMPEEEFIVFHPFSSNGYNRSQYSDEKLDNYIEFCNNIINNSKKKVVILGNENDAELVSMFDLSDAVNLCGKLNVWEALSLVFFADKTIGIDSVFTTWSSICGKPTFIYKTDHSYLSPEAMAHMFQTTPNVKEIQGIDPWEIPINEINSFIEYEGWKNYYSDDYFSGKNKKSSYGDWYRHDIDFYKFEASFLKEEFALTSESKVLEIGCSHGGVIENLVNGGVDAQGVDIAEWSKENCAGYMKDRIHILDVESQELPFPNDYFDLVFSFQTMEHLERSSIDGFTMREISRVTKDGGKIFLQTPMLKDGMKYEDLLSETDKSHRTFLTKEEWNKIGTSSGMLLDEVSSRKLQDIVENKDSTWDGDNIVFVKRSEYTCCLHYGYGDNVVALPALQALAESTDAQVNVLYSDHTDDMMRFFKWADNINLVPLRAVRHVFHQTDEFLFDSDEWKKRVERSICIDMCPKNAMKIKREKFNYFDPIEESDYYVLQPVSNDVVPRLSPEDVDNYLIFLSSLAKETDKRLIIVGSESDALMMQETGMLEHLSAIEQVSVVAGRIAMPNLCSLILGSSGVLGVNSVCVNLGGLFGKKSVSWITRDYPTEPEFLEFARETGMMILEDEPWQSPCVNDIFDYLRKENV